MAVIIIRRVLTRLLRLRELEEEQTRIQLESAVGDRDRVQEDLAQTADYLTQGRQSFRASVTNRDAMGRTGAVLETEQARQQRLRILPRLQAAEAEVTRQREEYLLRRTGRRQVETLVENEKEMAAVETARRVQQILDDWYGRRGQMKRTAARFVSGPVFSSENSIESWDTESTDGNSILERESKQSDSAACLFPMKSS
jgi:flagellar export protein FliJ